MLTNKTFDNLFLLGRPASGKSEFIDYMKKCDINFRREKHFIGDLAFVDDFVYLWEKFEEDNLWEKITGQRLHSKRAGHGYILKGAELFDFLIERLNFEIKRKFSNNKKFYDKGTLLIEFSRGGERPYKPALDRFDKEILNNAAILYVSVSGDESRRRNEARYQEKLKSSILAHKTPDEDMDRFYKDDDWKKITNDLEQGHIKLNGVNVPFVTMNNEPESKDPKVLAERYGIALSKLYNLCVSV